MMNRLMQPDNLSLVKSITMNVAMFGALALILFMAILWAIQKFFNIYLFLKKNDLKESKMNFYAYKLLISAWVVFILPRLLNIINLAYNYTLWYLVTLILWNVNIEKSVLVNIFARLFLSISLLVIFFISIWPFYSWKKLWKIWWLYLIFVFIVMFLSHLLVYCI